MSKPCPQSGQPLPGPLRGLRHDATPGTVDLAQAMIERDQKRQETGAFFALGHERGRRYEDWVAFDGTRIRFWGDGASEVFP